LAPANQYTKHIIYEVEVYCTHCTWHGRLRDYMKAIYVRV